ncbi:MAG: 5'-3' exonuclease H3TH domain-containing protein [Candidatus Gottesmanbacteria bacterium]
MNRLIIIDGNAILHRAFHALPPLTAPDGTLVNAVYGFTSMLLRLITDLTPTHIAVTFDRPAPTFRKKLYADYQIKRPKMDEGLVQQIPLVHDVVSAMHVPIYECDGFEADDIIGSLCKKYTKNIDQIIIVTGDKDLLQLATDTIKIYMPTRGLSEAKLYGPKETIERLGVTPEQIPDYKALAGDQSDNYPGVPGIGPKTAIELLTTYISIEELYKHINRTGTKISPRTKEKLIMHKQLAILSKTLATIKNDIPIEEPIKPISLAQFSTHDVVIALQRFGFHSLIKRIQTSTGTEKPTITKKREGRKKSIDEQMSLI